MDDKKIAQAAPSASRQCSGCATADNGLALYCLRCHESASPAALTRRPLEAFATVAEWAQQGAAHAALTDERMNLERTMFAIRVLHEDTGRRDWFDAGFRAARALLAASPADQDAQS